MKTLGLKTILLLAMSVVLWAEAPTTINYQGYLKDSSGNAITGSKSITFNLYTVSTAGSAIWTSTKTITVTDGIYSTVLGDTAVLTGLNFDAQYYLGINVASDGEMTPRQPLTSVAYAIKAKKTEQVGTLTASKWCSSDGTVVNCTQDAPMLKTTYDTNADSKIDANKINGSTTNGQVLTTDGSGNTSWQTPSGGGGVTLTEYTNTGSGAVVATCSSGTVVSGGCETTTGIDTDGIAKNYRSSTTTWTCQFYNYFAGGGVNGKAYVLCQ